MWRCSDAVRDQAGIDRLQHEIVTTQFESIVHERRPCARCGVMPSIKDYQPMRFRSLFDDVELRVPTLSG